jgi:hypothetical protein
MPAIELKAFLEIFPESLRLTAGIIALVAAAAAALRAVIAALRAALHLRNEWYERPRRPRAPL